MTVSCVPIRLHRFQAKQEKGFWIHHLHVLFSPISTIHPNPLWNHQVDLISSGKLLIWEDFKVGVAAGLPGHPMTPEGTPLDSAGIGELNISFLFSERFSSTWVGLLPVQVSPAQP